MRPRFFLAVLCVGLSAVHAQTLRQQADRLGILIGAAIDPEHLGESDYTSALQRDWSMVEAENAMKWAAIRPTQSTFDFSGGDQIVAFAQQNGMLVRGHNLAWYSYNPAWLTNGNFSTGDLNSILQNHVQTVVQHYAGKVFAWDVVNEAFNADGSLRHSIWYDSPGIGDAAQGTKYIEDIFRWAHAADPKALLFYNDYSAETINAKSDAIYAMVKDFKQRGVPIDGVGLQMHLNVDSSLPQLAANMFRFAALGVQIHITEFDVAVATNPDGSAVNPGDLAKQAQIYQTITQTCLADIQCTAIQTWGVGDKYTWIVGFSNGRNGLPLMLDQSFVPKPAYQAVLASLTHTGVLARPPKGVSRDPGNASAIAATYGSIWGAPKSLVTLFGQALSSSTAVASTPALPSTLGGVTVSVTDSSGQSMNALLEYVSPTQINLQIPAGLSPGPATLSVAGAASPVNAGVSLGLVAPSLFTANQNGMGVAAATAVRTFIPTSRQEPVAVFDCSAGVGKCVSVPIDTGVDAPVYLTLYGTGIRNWSSLGNVSVTIGGMNIPVLYAGPQTQYSGLDQVNIPLPLSLRGLGETDLQLVVDGQAANAVKINIQ